MNNQKNGTPAVSAIEYSGPFTVASTTTPSASFSINIPYQQIRICPIIVSGEVLIKKEQLEPKKEE
ncbi:MAG: hypothetical protein IKO51_10505 [Clostridia bacterium]|nr:hypothetical protein [Clostridia bacterium]